MHTYTVPGQRGSQLPGTLHTAHRGKREYVVTLPTSVRKKDGGRIPGAQAVGNMIEVRVVYSAANGKTNSFKFAGHYTTVPADMQTLAGNIWTGLSSAWSTNLAPHMVAAVSLQRVEVRDMSLTLNPVFIGTGAPIAGTAAGPALPPDMAIVLTENVRARGRGLKGRMYLSGFDVTADAGNGVIAAATQAAVNNFGTALFNLLTAQTLAPAVAQVHRAAYIGLTGTQHSERLATFVLVSSYASEDTEWDTQRRRGF